MIDFKHKPIMLNEVVDGLNIKENGTYLDCTVGGAGHSTAIAKKLKSGLLICLDKDDDALCVSKERLKKYNAKFFHTDFKDFEEALNHFKVDKLDGILLDLGVSSYQLDSKERGFSYNINSKLDMRMDQTQKLSAYEVVNTYSKEDLARIFKEYGEEQFANNIAKHIVEDRKIKNIETTFDLVEIIQKAIPAKIRFKGSHPAKKVFQAIRIEVNSELDKLYDTVIKLFQHLKKGGRLTVITFHSLEDRLVKNIFKEKCEIDEKVKGLPNIPDEYLPDFRLVSTKAIVPSDEEIEMNPRSRSSKLRVIERIK